MTGAVRKSLIKVQDSVDFYQHQVDGVRLGNRMASFILADEMGLGKSLTAATVAAVDFERGYAARVLIICPSFLKWNWAEELDRMTNFTYTIYHGTPKERSKIRDDFDSDILITNYEQIVNDFEPINAMSWDIVIVDEAHFIKSKSSKRSKAIRQLKRGRMFLLTGSPMLNRPDELWALLNACDPNRFARYYPFVNRFCVMGGWQSKQIVGAKNKDELRGLLSEYMIRRLKKDCLDLPDKQVIPIIVELHPAQRKIYDQMDAELRLEIPGDPDPMEAENILVKMLRLKQICATPASIGLPDDSYKLDKAMEMIVEFTTDPDDRSPVVVFTQFRAVQTAMGSRLDAAGVPYWVMNGDTPKDKRIALVNEWAAHPQPGVIMIMLQMGVGLNLTAANKAIFIDRLYVPKLNEQAEDRIHRIGADLTKPVQVFNIVAKNTVEERIEQILKAKRKLFDSVVEVDASWKQELIKQLANAS
jgi:SNF2 family DNA or RNA helicase